MLTIFGKKRDFRFVAGFTLAEVLITLGIIGVVAAMTIPTIMNNISEMQFKVAAKKAYSRSNEALNLLKQEENGDLSYYKNNKWTFKPAFMKYFKVVKDCGLNDCVPTSVASDVYTSLSGAKANTDAIDNGQFVTSDGMFFAITNSDVVDKIYVTVDVNGYLKKPNVYGKDIFSFQLLNDNLVPMGVANTDYPSSTYCNKASNNSLQGFGCMALVMQEKDY